MEEVKTRSLYEFYNARADQLASEYYQTLGMVEAMISWEKNPAAKARLSEVYVRLCEGRNRIEAVTFEIPESTLKQEVSVI